LASRTCRLTPEETEAVEAYLAAHPEMPERWAQYVSQREELRAAFAGPAGESVPTRLCLARLIGERRRRLYKRLGGIAAALALLIPGGFAGWGAHDLLPSFGSSASEVLASSVFDDAIAAHRTFSVETRHPVEVGANEEAHLVQWLSKRLGHPRPLAPTIKIGTSSRTVTWRTLSSRMSLSRA
jgi:anti-sigma factor RsiW